MLRDAEASGTTLDKDGHYIDKGKFGLENWNGDNSPKNGNSSPNGSKPTLPFLTGQNSNKTFSNNNSNNNSPSGRSHSISPGGNNRTYSRGSPSARTTRPFDTEMENLFDGLRQKLKQTYDFNELHGLNLFSGRKVTCVLSVPVCRVELDENR
jgi:hypothetical protein